eukprot:9100570-Pyramimonas_sp.AAC.1
MRTEDEGEEEGDYRPSDCACSEIEVNVITPSRHHAITSPVAPAQEPSPPSIATHPIRAVRRTVASETPG